MKNDDPILMERAARCLDIVRTDFDRAYFAQWSRRHPGVSRVTVGCYVGTEVLCPACHEKTQRPGEPWSTAQMQSEFEDFGEECAHCGIVLVAPIGCSEYNHAEEFDS
jgi:hypothetical protein